MSRTGTWVFLFSLIFVVLWSRTGVFGRQPDTCPGRRSSQDDPKKAFPICNLSGVSRCNRSIGGELVIRAHYLNLSGVLSGDNVTNWWCPWSLDVSRNSFTSIDIEFWRNSTCLKNLNVSNNSITGSLSDDVVKTPKYLESLDLSYNHFSGELPMEAFGELSHLRVLNASGNRFNVSKFRKELHLQYLDLSNNIFDQEKLNMKHLPSLEYLNLSNCSLTGNFSLDTEKLANLTVLDLSHNQLTGRIPNGSTTGLKELDLSYNKFNGDMHNFSNWSTMVHLDLSENELGGKIYVGQSEVKGLEYLSLSKNSFNQQSFPNITHLKSLKYLNLSRTNLTGEFPNYILKFDNLTVLDLSHNNLTGDIPEKFLQKLNKMTFDLSNNSVSFCPTNFPGNISRLKVKGLKEHCAGSPGNQSPGDSSSSKRKTIVKIAVGVVVPICALILVFVCVGLLYKRKGSFSAAKHINRNGEYSSSGPFLFETESRSWVADVKLASSVPVVIIDKPLHNFTFEDLLAGTRNFDRLRLLAEKRSGLIYEGVLPGGARVAIKVIVHDPTLTNKEAEAELEYLGRINHPNLVPLIGYCLAGMQRLVIYEYMENGNLHDLLHSPQLENEAADNSSGVIVEDEFDNIPIGIVEACNNWIFRHSIALGTARALAYLHHGCSPRIVHKDVKASTIFLDSSFQPRLSDFGLEKLIGGDHAGAIAYGSPGYSPPGLLESEISAPVAESDVYDFGIVLFELVSGKKPTGDEYPGLECADLVSWARGLVKKDQLHTAIDPKIRGTAPEKQMSEALRIGYLCTADAPSKRPSMQQVLGLLKDIEPRMEN